MSKELIQEIRISHIFKLFPEPSCPYSFTPKVKTDPFRSVRELGSRFRFLSDKRLPKTIEKPPPAEIASMASLSWEAREAVAIVERGFFF